jgi:hypothetical protein
MAKYNIGQVLTAKTDLELEGIFGTKRTIKAGSKAYIGTDKLAHHTNGTLQPLAIDDTVEGYSTEGLASWIYRYLSSRTRLPEAIEEYEITREELEECIADALEELGMYDNTGNRS